ncbi:MAG: MipA/OmpV family protein [Pseudomonadales bacterium]|nr:MipA/OmpV family protein [Pseudomonadales bacterium]
MSNIKQHVAFVISAILSPLCFAEWELPEFNGLIAGAVTYENLPYRGVDIEYNPSLLVLGSIGDGFIEGNRAGYPVKRLGWGTLSLVGQIRMHQYLDASDSPLTDEDRKRGIELGPQLSVPLGNGYISQFTIFQDLGVAHESQEFEASVYKRFRFEELSVIATLAAQYHTADLMNYYVGTEDYNAKAELTQELELLATYPLSEHWSAIAVWRYYRHGSDFENSPLTNSDTTQRFAIGLGMRF